MTLLLLDTHLLLWSAGVVARMPARAQSMIEDENNDLAFSVTSLWEIAIKASLGRSDFVVDASKLRRELLSRGHREFVVTAEHAIAAGGLPWLHRDPFDRMLIAQARVERALLLTADSKLARYGDSVLHCG